MLAQRIRTAKKYYSDSCRSARAFTVGHHAGICEYRPDFARIVILSEAKDVNFGAGNPSAVRASFFRRR